MSPAGLSMKKQASSCSERSPVLNASQIPLYTISSQIILLSATGSSTGIPSISSAC